jgi:uncharacterized membrane protein YphA (DoxX/SURF4 family)
VIFVSSGYLVLIAVLAFSGLGKLRRLSAFRGQIADYQLIPDSLVRSAAGVLAGTETSCAVLLALPWTRRAGAALAIVLLAVFLVAMSLTWARGRRIPCGCFGGTADLDTVGPSTVLRTALLGLLAVGTLLVSRDGRQPAGASLPVQFLLAALMLILIFLLAESVRLLAELGHGPAGAGNLTGTASLTGKASLTGSRMRSEP